MSVIANRVKVAVDGTPGTGTINLGAAVTGFQSFADGGITNGQVVSYAIEDGDAWEIGTGTYTTGTPNTLSRTVIESSNSDAAINLSGSAVVFITALSGDLQNAVDMDQGVATTDSPSFAGLTATTADINGGTIDGTVIGGSTPAAISGTTLEASGNVDFKGGDISFYEDTGTTPKFFWDASAEALGIGTSSPAQILHVQGSGAAARIDNSNAGANVYGDILSETSGLFALRSRGGGSTHGSIDFRTWNGTDDLSRIRIDSSGNVGIGTISPSEKLDVNGNVTISGSISKGSGLFKIDHPLKPETHYLVHSFIEGPQADNIYRGKVALADGKATVNLDEAGRMTEGTFVALNGNVQCFTTNEDGWTAVRGKVEGNILTIEAQDAACAGIVSWLVIGERHDQHMIEANCTDEQGRVITEPEKEIAQ